MAAASRCSSSRWWRWWRHRSGLLVGLVAGFAGGVADVVLMRVTDVFLSFPGLVLALAFAAALGQGLSNAILAISLTAWPPIARLARAETLAVARADYIEAARLLGASRTRLLLRHVLPVCVPSVIVRVTLMMGSIILTAAGLGFLGLGAQPPLPEWGVMIATGRKYMLDHWWMTTVPGVAILRVSLGFNLFGDAVRDVLDPRHETMSEALLTVERSARRLPRRRRVRAGDPRTSPSRSGARRWRSSANPDRANRRSAARC